MTTTIVDPNLFNVPNPYSTTTQGTNTNGYNDTSVFTAQNAQQQQQTATTAPTTDANAKDGKDDGKIGFFEKIGNAIAGVPKAIGNMVKGVVENPIQSLLMIGACFIPVVGPFIGAGLAAYGVVNGVGQIAKAAERADNATTDAEAEAAWQDIGGGVFQTGASIIGAKAGLKGVKSTVAAGKAGIAAEAGMGLSKTGGFMRGSLGMEAGATGGAAAIGKTMAKGTLTNAQNALEAMKPKNIYESAKTKLSNVREKFTPEGRAAAAEAKIAKNQAKINEQGQKIANKEITKAGQELESANKRVADLDEQINTAKKADTPDNSAIEKLETQKTAAIEKQTAAQETYNKTTSADLPETYTEANKKYQEAQKAFEETTADPKSVEYKNLEAKRNSAQKEFNQQEAIQKAKAEAQTNYETTAEYKKLKKEYDNVATETMKMEAKIKLKEAQIKAMDQKVQATEIEKIKTEIETLNDKMATNSTLQETLKPGLEASAKEAAAIYKNQSTKLGGAPTYGQNLKNSVGGYIKPAVSDEEWSQISQQAAATTPTQTAATTPFQMPELLTYQVDADKINKDAMNTQITAQALTNGSYGSMLNYES